jgi:hypothetical protein
VTSCKANESGRTQNAKQQHGSAAAAASAAATRPRGGCRRRRRSIAQVAMDGGERAIKRERRERRRRFPGWRYRDWHRMCTDLLPVRVVKREDDRLRRADRSRLQDHRWSVRFRVGIEPQSARRNNG